MHYIRTIAVDSHFQMQMTACSPTGMPNIADNLPGLYLLAGGDTDAGTVCIQRFQPAAVVNLDIVGFPFLSVVSITAVSAWVA